MFQPVGGMDMITKAFHRAISTWFGSGVIKLQAVVTRIELRERRGVAVTYLRGGMEHTEVADYCVSTIPLPVLKDVTLDGFSDAFHGARKAVGFADTCKVGWQANRRFWEEDDAIYGGISWTDHNITQMWYPSNDYFSANGTLTGAYNYEARAKILGDNDPQDRLAVARSGAIQLHPQFQDPGIVPMDKGVSIAWHKVPYQLGGWAAWEFGKSTHDVAYKQLLQPEGNGTFFVAGDQVSPLPGWQEGAVMSAYFVIGQIEGTAQLAATAVVHAPDSVALTQGFT